MFLKLFFFSLYLSEKYEQNKNQGRTRNEFLMLLADLFSISSPDFLQLFVSGWSPGETLG